MSVRLLFLTKRYVLFSAIHWCLRFFLTSVFHPYFPHPLQDLCDWVQPTLKASRDWLINQSPCIINNNLILFIDRPVSRGVDALEHCLSFALSVSLVMCFMFCPPEGALSLCLCPPQAWCWPHGTPHQAGGCSARPGWRSTEDPTGTAWGGEGRGEETLVTLKASAWKPN